MKYIWVLLIFPLVIAATQVAIVSFTDCDRQWLVTNITINWDGETKNISADVAYNDPSEKNQIYEVYITLNECNNRTICTGDPIVTVNEINCNDQDLTQYYNNICLIGQEMAKLEWEKDWLIGRYGGVYGTLLRNLLFCISFGNIQINSD